MAEEYALVEGLLSYAEKSLGLKPIGAGERIDPSPGMGREMLILALEKASELGGEETASLGHRFEGAFRSYSERHAPSEGEKSPFVLLPYARLKGAYEKFGAVRKPF